MALTSSENVRGARPGRLANSATRAQGEPESIARAAEGSRHRGRSFVSALGNLTSLAGRKTVGVEIKSTHVNMVAVEGSGQARRATLARSAAVPEGSTLHSPEFADFLQAQLRHVQGLNRAGIWAVLSASRGEVWPVTVPAVKSKDLDSAVYWTAKQEHGFAREGVVFDYRLAGKVRIEGVEKYRALVSTAPKEDVYGLKYAFARAGLGLEGITLFPFGLQNLFAGGWVDSGKDAFAVLDIDRHSSSITIFNADADLLFSRAIKTGVQSMAESIIQEQGAPPLGMRASGTGQAHERYRDADLDHKAAFELIARMESGGEPGGDESPGSFAREEVLEMMVPALERLVRQVERTIDYSVNVQANPAPAVIHLCGRLASAEPVADFFREQLGLTTRVLDPLDPVAGRLSAQLDPLSRAERIFLAPAAGLAMSDTRHTPNLLYTPTQRKKTRRQRGRAFAAAAVLLAAYLAVGGYWHQLRQDVHKTRQEVSELKQRLQEYAPLVDRERLEGLAAKIREDASALRSYSRRFLPAAAINELIAATPQRVSLLSVRLEQKDSGPQKGGAKTLTLEGSMTGERDRLQTMLAGYLHRLRGSVLFETTKIRQSSIRQTEDAQNAALSFVIEIGLRRV